jgi:hypothetical protein
MNKLLNSSTSLSPATEPVLDAAEHAGANYWKGSEIDREYLVTITSATKEEFKEKDGTITHKIVLGTDEGRKLVMNITRNQQAMRARWGRNAYAWPGNRAVLFPAQTVFAGDLVASIGFKPIARNQIAGPEAQKVIEHDGPPGPPPVAAEYDDNPAMVPEGAAVVDDVTQEVTV